MSLKEDTFSPEGRMLKASFAHRREFPGVPQQSFPTTEWAAMLSVMTNGSFHLETINR